MRGGAAGYAYSIALDSRLTPFGYRGRVPGGAAVTQVGIRDTVTDTLQLSSDVTRPQLDPTLIRSPLPYAAMLIPWVLGRALGRASTPTPPRWTPPWPTDPLPYPLAGVHQAAGQAEARAAPCLRAWPLVRSRALPPFETPPTVRGGRGPIEKVVGRTGSRQRAGRATALVGRAAALARTGGGLAGRGGGRQGGR